MKAVRIARFGGPEVIHLEEIERPAPGDNQVLVRVKAAGVGPWDALIRAGKSVLSHTLPLVLGSDLAGSVVAVGHGATGLVPGSAVFGVTNGFFTGAYAEYALAEPARIALLPSAVSPTLAAAAPVVAVTALQMLFDHGGLEAGQRVLILGAGGSVGACAVQLARKACAFVIGTATPRSLAYARRIGVQQVLDSTPGAALDGAPVDLVIDTVGGPEQTRALAALKPGGRMISAVSQPNAAEAARLGVAAKFILVDVTTSALERVADALSAGELSVRIGAVLTLAQAREAHEMLDGLRPRASGKMVLRISDA